MSVRTSILQDVFCVPLTDGGRNLGFGSSSCPASIPVGDPRLDPNGLQMNGGLTPTIALRKGSAAVNRIPLTACTDQNGKRLKVDQRGYIRPAPNQKACDIGAFERGAVSRPRGQ